MAQVVHAHLLQSERTERRAEIVAAEAANVQNAVVVDLGYSADLPPRPQQRLGVAAARVAHLVPAQVGNQAGVHQRHVSR